MIREAEIHGVRLTLDAAPQVLSLECPEDVAWLEDELVPTPSLTTLRLRGFVSASVVAAKAKSFDDGLIAAVELAAQFGAGKFPGKRNLLNRIASRLEPGAAAERLLMRRRDLINGLPERIAVLLACVASRAANSGFDRLGCSGRVDRNRECRHAFDFSLGSLRSLLGAIGEQSSVGGE